MKGIIFVGILLCAFSCKPSFSQEEEAIEVFFSKIQREGEHSPVNCLVIIPENSCGVCVSGTFHFLEKNASLFPEVFTIVTSFSSTKDLNLKHGANVFKNPNVFLDKKDLSSQSGLRFSSPTFVHLKQGVVLDVISINPKNMNQTFSQTIKHLKDLNHEKESF